MALGISQWMCQSVIVRLLMLWSKMEEVFSIKHQLFHPLSPHQWSYILMIKLISCEINRWLIGSEGKNNHSDGAVRRRSRGHRHENILKLQCIDDKVLRTSSPWPQGDVSCLHADISFVASFPTTDACTWLDYTSVTRRPLGPVYRLGIATIGKNTQSKKAATTLTRTDRRQ